MSEPHTTFEGHGSRALYALYSLHMTIATNRPLFNLQLAATHVAFMLDSDPSQDVGNSMFILHCLFKVNQGSPGSSSIIWCP